MHTLPDYLQPGLRLVFVGFNPSMRSAAVGHYYAGPGNLFWPLLYESGLLPTPLTYAEDARILEFGIGLTDLVKRPTPSSADLSPGEARAGVPQLHTKLVTYAPRVVCFNGKGVYAWYTNRAGGHRTAKRPYWSGARVRRPLHQRPQWPLATSRQSGLFSGSPSIC